MADLITNALYPTYLPADNTSIEKPVKDAVKDFYNVMLYIVSTMAKGAGTINIKGSTYNVADTGTIVLADFAVNEASQGIQFVLKQQSYINDLYKEAGRALG